MKRLLVILALSLPTALAAQVVNIAGYAAGGSRQSLKVPLNSVIRLVLPSGQRALVQFTSLGDATAEYRWKYKRTSESKLEVGSGSVVEKYERFPGRNGRGNEVLPLPGHDLIIRAGEIRGEWSAGGDEYCYFYYTSKLARVEVVGAASFEGNP
jgi:hypothetical protein